ncbi:MAG TPA: TMEM165/GDT1 family protein [Oculatellaceae cyanobacterium]|jgi:putative Ca2+/H+ antiporter (TMEM165/GDT1 family)
MEAFLTSTSMVALAEIGDKTQLLALLLVSRFQRPWPIIAGILLATLLNHAIAGYLGEVIANLLSPGFLRWAVGLSFLAIAIWTMIPDKMEDGELPALKKWGIFITTLLSFFLVEIGDKTQIATVVLAAHYHNLAAVVGGTTLGMMLANAPVVFLGDKLAHQLPLDLIRKIVAILFALLGIAALLGFGLK